MNFTELTDYFDTLEFPPAKSSQAAYRSQYKRLRTDFKKPLKPISVDEIKEYLNKVPHPNTRKNLLNIFVMLKRADYPNEYMELTELRKEFFDKIEKVVQEKNQQLEGQLPTFKQLEKHLRESYGVDYVVNYILMYFQTRAKDLDLIITKELPEADDINYLLINEDGSSVMYHRGNYKTVKSHGAKDHIIREKKFISTVLSLLGSKKEVKLLPFKQSDKALRNSTLFGISESEHVKVLVHHYFNQKNINRLTKIGENRGTNLNLILRNYNLDFNVANNESDTPPE